MIKIDRYETISKLILSEFKKGVATNNFLSKEDLEAEIKNGSLYAHKFDGGLLILRERENHYVLNYYINNFDTSIDKTFLKDVVVEIVSREERDSSKEIVSYFKSQGYEICLERVRYVNNFCENVSCDVTDKIQLCKSEDSSFAMQMLKENFNPYTGCIPIMDSFLKDIECGNVYIYKNDKIEGLLHVRKGKVSSEIKHLVVFESERNKGIATKLVSRYFLDDTAKKKTVWTGKENVAARKFYEKVGYELDGYKSVVLKKKGM